MARSGSARGRTEPQPGRLRSPFLPEERPKIDPNFAEVTEDAEESTKESLRRKWAQLEAMVGTDKRIALVAEDLVKHWEARYAAMEGNPIPTGLNHPAQGCAGALPWDCVP